ncbi:MAG: hypothetical protein ABJN69_12560 [Hellea sp.]
MRLLYLTGILILGLTACVAPPATSIPSDGPVIKIADFDVIAGDEWTGTLTYLDYSANKRVTIPTAASVRITSPTQLRYSVSYPKEPWEDTKAALKISKSGRVLDGHPVTYRETQADGSLKIRTAHQGTDNNKPAHIRMSYTLSASKFTISKDVRMKDDTDFTNRNIYAFTRP